MELQRIDEELPITVPIRLESADLRAADDGAALTLRMRSVSTRTSNSASGIHRLLISPSRHLVDSPAGLSPFRLRAVRGRKINAEYSLREGVNYLGRSEDDRMDIDLSEQEPADNIWISRRHAAVHLHNGALEIEDLNSTNGTFLNRARLAPGERRALKGDDVVQVGMIQLRVFT